MNTDSAQVREFIERLVETLVSGQLDDVKVNRAYTHPEYKPLPEEETPSAVHAALKQRVQHIIHEAMTLPNLKNHVPTENGTAFHKWDDDITSMTYEDILATAILNKVIERFQQRTDAVLPDAVDGDRGVPAFCSIEQAPKYISRVEIGVNNHDGDSSLQEGLGNWSESSHAEPLSMTIEECIEEEVTMYDSAGEEEEEEEEDRSSDGMAANSSELDFYLSGLSFIKRRRVPFPELGVDIVDGAREEEQSESSQPTDLISPVDSWEENWLFQRRHLKAGGTSDAARRSPMPVPMLVPNPSEDFRARIGDRDAEEISDLSDCSDGALEDIVLSGVETAPTDIHVPEDSVTSERHAATVERPQEQSFMTTAAEGSTEMELTEATNLNLVKAPSVECLSEFGQQDSEYTEDYALVTQRQVGSLTEQIGPASAPVPKPRTFAVPSRPSKSPECETWADAKQETELATPPRPGTIAEREHRKWENAPPLPNNPYSPENINKRLSKQSAGFSSRSSSCTSIDFPELEATQGTSPLKVICASGELDYKRYGRDYYINHSRMASGEIRSSSRVTSPLLQQVCDPSNLLDIEQQALHRNIYRNSFRACNDASLNFTVNPLFEPVQSEVLQTDDVVGELDTVSAVEGMSVRDGDAGPRVEDQTLQPTKLGQESGYSSLLDSIADPPVHLLRLLPPSKPQMVERSFESLASLHRSESLMNNRRKPEVTLEMGGSLKVKRKHKMQNGAQLLLL
ncbi:hypothetical protein B7P43_G09476 [Cryptotermes secundus]|uniref:Uncharacterized protein n=1 Tax=Cryptotermes secundus TaxID=105785 RepID=A0A2J7R2P4_9NEOP|nr:hypothetical protein B7P43_G09476 [Cryptotermes secundus]